MEAAVQRLILPREGDNRQHVIEQLLGLLPLAACVEIVYLGPEGEETGGHNRMDAPIKELDQLIISPAAGNIHSSLGCLKEAGILHSAVLNLDLCADNRLIILKGLDQDLVRDAGASEVHILHDEEGRLLLVNHLDIA